MSGAPWRGSNGQQNVGRFSVEKMFSLFREELRDGILLWRPSEQKCNWGEHEEQPKAPPARSARRDRVPPGVITAEQEEEQGGACGGFCPPTILFEPCGSKAATNNHLSLWLAVELWQLHGSTSGTPALRSFIYRDVGEPTCHLCSTTRMMQDHHFL